MSGGTGDDENDDIAPSFEEQIKFLRKARQAGTTRFQKTTEFNVKRKLRRELANPTFDQAAVDNRLESALNRETHQDIFGDSLEVVLIGKKIQDGAPRLDDDLIVGHPKPSSMPAIDRESLPSKAPRSASEALLPELGQPEQLHSASFTARRRRSLSRSLALRGLFPGPSTPEQSQSLAAVGAQALLPESSVMEKALSNQELVSSIHLESDSDELRAQSALGLKNGMSPEQSETKRQFSQNYIMQAIQFKEETGLDLVLDDKETINLMLNASGESLNVYSVEFSNSGLEEAKIFATTLIYEYVNVLSTDFGLEFGSRGDVAVRQLLLVAEQQLSPGKLLLSRMPRIDELKALQRALEFSWPATYQSDNQMPMLVAFVNDTIIEGDESGALLKYMEDGRPILFISPTLWQRGRPTDLDPASADDYEESWQASIMREFAWKSAVDCSKFPLALAEIEMLGWKQLESPQNSETFALKTAMGQWFCPYELALIPEQAWACCNERGEFVNEMGKPVKQATEICFLSNDEMAKQAAVRPAGQQFFNSEEEIVDGLRCFRQGADSRAQLARTSPVLYKIAKALDQLSINRCYAPSQGYAGLIRSAKGPLQDKNLDNQKELLQFEQEHIKSPG